MANLSEVKAESDWGSASARINQNFNNINTELAGIKNATTKNKGYFKTDAALKLAYPTAKPGDIAYVGLNYPYQIWEWSNGWQDTKQTGGAENVSLVDYYTKTDIDSQQTEQNAIIDNALVEYNVSKFHPTSGINGSNKYTLETAIAQVPSKYRSVGIKCAFINASGKPECWKYQGGSWTAGNFTKEADGGNKILIWLTDASTTRKQVALSERKTLLQISYKNSDGDIVNEQYIGTSLADTEWVKDTNWQKIFDQEQISELNNKINEGEKTVDFLYKAEFSEQDISSSVKFTDGYFLQANESAQSAFGKEYANSTTSVSEYIDLTNVSEITISVFKSNTTTDNGCVFYDDNKKALKGYRFENQGEIGTYNLKLNIPSNYKYVRTSILTSDKQMFICKLSKISGGEGFVVDIDKRVSAVENKIESIEDGIKTNFTSGSGILVDSRYGELGSIKTNSTLSYSDYVDCSGYDLIELTMPIFPSESGFGLCFYDSDKVAIIGYNINKGDAYGVEKRTLEIPNSASFFRTSYYTDTESYESFQGKLLKKDPITETVNKLYRQGEDSDYTDIEWNPIFTDGVYLSTGSSNIGDELGPSNDTSVTDFIKIGGNVLLSAIQVSVIQTTSGTATGVVLYDSSKNPIKGYSFQGSVKKTIQAELIDFPGNTYYLRTTIMTSDKSALSVKIKEDLSEGIVPDINRRIVNLEDNIASSDDEINIIHYGAKDGEDITDALEKVLKSLSNKGGNIYIPKGTYKFKRPVTWKSKVNLRGDGIGLTVLKPTSDLSVFIGSDISDYTMKDFTIDGNEQKKNGTVAYAKGIFQTKLTNVTYRDLEIKNTSATGLGVDFFISGVIDNVRCDNCGRDGDLSAPQGAAGCSGIGIGVGGFNRGNETLMISNCHCNNCKQNGIFVESQSGGDGQTVSGTIVIGCTAEGNRIGFGVSGGDSTQFIGCSAYSNHHAGFAYDSGTMGGSSSGSRPKFIGCISKSNGQSIPEDYPDYMGQENGFGWYILKDFGGIELIGCNSLKNKKSGIEIVNGISRLNIDGGEISENGEHGINLNGNISEFRITPLSVRYNGGDGIRINASLSKGLIKGISITKNNNGINKTENGNIGDAIISENFVYGNTISDSNIVE